ncbi:uncharacterized protein CELE_F56C3.8 [Caenorhabditis elegans]|uniref:Secreted protein n=1 Tax=Caenorhabditis elegans TaxID=6239 RepID=O61759_CAEEL|nr:Secreted protein [Caenorhabditis elegans]CCD69813.1 Secreted protein [Caenorhabditis elegans]|eukprot:NP_508256.1 Uncharacterized protein CELE_F56C3.8 [Caenorhabditis elegans]
MNRHFIVTKMKNTVLLLILALFFISLRDDGLQMPNTDLKPGLLMQMMGGLQWEWGPPPSPVTPPEAPAG